MSRTIYSSNHTQALPLLLGRGEGRVRSRFPVAFAAVLSGTIFIPHSALCTPHSALLSQLPTLAPGDLERWLIAAVAVAGIVALALKLFVRKPSLEAEFVTKEEFRIFRAAVERELGGLRDRIDSRHLTMLETLDKLRADLLADAERRDARLQTRLTQLESGLARLDERTKS